MIETLEIKNFKSIKKKRFGLRNLNLLLGLNGMGKSSFVQMLLLLHDADVVDAVASMSLHAIDIVVAFASM